MKAKNNTIITNGSLNKEMKKIKDYEKLQFDEQKETNLILWVNTIFTIITGIGVLIISLFEYFK